MEKVLREQSVMTIKSQQEDMKIINIYSIWDSRKESFYNNKTEVLGSLQCL